MPEPCDICPHDKRQLAQSVVCRKHLLSPIVVTPAHDEHVTVRFGQYHLAIFNDPEMGLQVYLYDRPHPHQVENREPLVAFSGADVETHKRWRRR